MRNPFGVESAGNIKDEVAELVGDRESSAAS